mmetsp:Transcript_27248/g.75156  ORF Transcript_27248/g.75156 Transcript_27248/m.75156 type:complete len:571 (-) Transcript_27248:288-2000(-)
MNSSSRQEPRYEQVEAEDLASAPNASPNDNENSDDEADMNVIVFLDSDFTDSHHDLEAAHTGDNVHENPVANDDDEEAPLVLTPAHGETSRHSSVSLKNLLPPLKNSNKKHKTHGHDDETDSTCEASSRTSSSSSNNSTQHDGDCHSQEDDDDEEGGERTQDVNDDDNSNDKKWIHDLMWLAICFAGIMTSFVAYGILLEYTTSGDKRLHELSFLFVTSVLGTITAYTGRTVRKETISDIPASRFLILGLMSLGSTFCAIRALRYVIFPIQVLARSCKPVPVMLIGTLLGKKYDRQKYINVMFIVLGVALFLGGGHVAKHSNDDADDTDHMNNNAIENTMWSHHLLDRSQYQQHNSVMDSQNVDEIGNDSSIPWMMNGQVIGVLLLLASLFFDGGTGAYEDKLMSIHKVEPFDLMFKFQFAKTLLSGFALLVLGQIPLFIDMLRQTGLYIVALGMCSAVGQVFIFITIARFGALTTSLMSLTRKVTTLTASIVIFGHGLSVLQFAGLSVSLTAMIMNFVNKKKVKTATSEEPAEMEQNEDDANNSLPADEEEYDVERVSMASRREDHERS